MSIFNRSKNDKAESDKSSSEESKTVSTPSDSVSDDDSRQSQKDDSKTETAKETETKSKAKTTKMDLAKDVLGRMYGKNGIKRKDIIKAFIEDCGLTKACPSQILIPRRSSGFLPLISMVSLHRNNSQTLELLK